MLSYFNFNFLPVNIVSIIEFSNIHHVLKQIYLELCIPRTYIPQNALMHLNINIDTLKKYLYSNVVSQNVPYNYNGGFFYLMSDSRCLQTATFYEQTYTWFECELPRT